MLDNSYSIKKANRLRNNGLPETTKYDGGKLFNLCLNLYTGFPLLDKPRTYIDSLVGENARILIISKNKCIHPENYSSIPVDTVLDTVKHSSTGIFCHRLEPNYPETRSNKTLCSASLGKNKIGKNISMAILFDSSYGDSTTQKESYYNLLSTFRELYTDISKSGAVTNLLNNRDSYRYLINGETGELVAKRLPIETGENDDNLAESIFCKIQNGNVSQEHIASLDSQIKNLTMTRFKLSRFEYQLLSFEIPENQNQNKAELEYDKLFRCFTHRIKNKLGSLQTASSQLTLQIGNVIDKDDITLTEIIQSETEFLDDLMTRTRQLVELEDPEFVQLDLMQTIKDVLADNSEKFSKKINVTIHSESDSCPIRGDSDLIKTAFNEIIQNGFENGEDIDIEIANPDKVVLTITNKLTEKMYGTLNSKALDITEPYISLKPNKIGLGLSIVTKILSLHDGTIDTNLDTDQKMITKIILPCSTIQTPPPNPNIQHGEIITSE